MLLICITLPLIRMLRSRSGCPATSIDWMKPSHGGSVRFSSAKFRPTCVLPALFSSAEYHLYHSFRFSSLWFANWPALIYFPAAMGRLLGPSSVVPACVAFQKCVPSPTCPRARFSVHLAGSDVAVCRRSVRVLQGSTNVMHRQTESRKALTMQCTR